MASPAPAASAPPHILRLDDDVAVIQIPSDLDYDDARAWIDAHLPLELPEHVESTCRLDLGDRAIDLLDLRRLLHHLHEHHGMQVGGLYTRREAIDRFAERELKLKLFYQPLPEPPAPQGIDEEHEPFDPAEVPEPGLATTAEHGTVADRPPEGATDAAKADEPPHSAPTAKDPHTAQAVQLDPEALADAPLVNPQDDEPGSAAPAEQDASDGAIEHHDGGRRTLHVPRTLRSGHLVSFEGDVTVFGDVNPGAQVTASGSIVVLGALKGVAHAGATGDEGTFILSLQLRATQLRIGSRIAIPPSELAELPEIAVVRDGRIVIEPYRSRLPR